MIRRNRLASFFRKCSTKVTAKKPPTPGAPSIRYDSKAFVVELGARLRKIRKESGLTLRALQLEHNYHLSQIQRMEKGEGISLPTLLRVAETFQIPVETLVAGIGLAAEGVETRTKTSNK